MTIKSKALLAALALGVAGAAVPAAAQQNQQQAQAPKINISNKARPAIAALSKAVDANQADQIPTLAAAANAVAQTPQDRYVIGQLQLKAAINAKNDPATLAALEAMIASGGAPATELGNLRFNVAKLAYNSNDYAKASQYLDQAIQADPNNVDALIIQAETRNKLQRPAEAVQSLQQAIKVTQAAGRPVDEKIYRRALAFAYNAKLPVASQISMDWLKAYPTSANWRDALKIYEQGAGLPKDDLIDLYRLQRAAGALKGEADYYPYVNGVLTRGLPGEAKAVLDEAFAANALNRTKPMWKDLYSSASTRTAADKASLAASERTALAAPSARQAMVTGDAYLGYGEYAKAAALYRAALGKSGVDKDQANLRLGIALARSGDKAAATTAFQSVQGQRASLAQLWMQWLNSRA